MANLGVSVGVGFKSTMTMTIPSTSVDDHRLHPDDEVETTPLTPSKHSLVEEEIGYRQEVYDALTIPKSENQQDMHSKFATIDDDNNDDLDFPFMDMLQNTHLIGSEAMQMAGVALADLLQSAVQTPTLVTREKSKTTSNDLDKATSPKPCSSSKENHHPTAMPACQENSKQQDISFSRSEPDTKTGFNKGQENSFASSESNRPFDEASPPSRREVTNSESSGLLVATEVTSLPAPYNNKTPCPSTTPKGTPRPDLRPQNTLSMQQREKQEVEVDQSENPFSMFCNSTPLSSHDFVGDDNREDVVQDMMIMRESQTEHTFLTETTQHQPPTRGTSKLAGKMQAASRAVSQAQQQMSSSSSPPPPPPPLSPLTDELMQLQELLQSTQSIGQDAAELVRSAVVSGWSCMDTRSRTSKTNPKGEQELGTSRCHDQANEQKSQGLHQLPTRIAALGNNDDLSEPFTPKEDGKAFISPTHDSPLRLSTGKENLPRRTNNKEKHYQKNQSHQHDHENQHQQHRQPLQKMESCGNCSESDPQKSLAPYPLTNPVGSSASSLSSSSSRQQSLRIFFARPRDLIPSFSSSFTSEEKRNPSKARKSIQKTRTVPHFHLRRPLFPTKPRGRSFTKKPTNIMGTELDNKALMPADASANMAQFLLPKRPQQTRLITTKNKAQSVLPIAEDRNQSQEMTWDDLFGKSDLCAPTSVPDSPPRLKATKGYANEDEDEIVIPSELKLQPRQQENLRRTNGKRITRTFTVNSSKMNAPATPQRVTKTYSNRPSTIRDKSIQTSVEPPAAFETSNTTTIDFLLPPSTPPSLIRVRQEPRQQPDPPSESISSSESMSRFIAGYFRSLAPWANRSSSSCSCRWEEETSASKALKQQGTSNPASASRKHLINRGKTVEERSRKQGK